MAIQLLSANIATKKCNIPIGPWVVQQPHYRVIWMNSVKHDATISDQWIHSLRIICLWMFPLRFQMNISQSWFSSFLSRETFHSSKLIMNICNRSSDSSSSEYQIHQLDALPGESSDHDWRRMQVMLSTICMTSFWRTIQRLVWAWTVGARDPIMDSWVQSLYSIRMPFLW